MLRSLYELGFGWEAIEYLGFIIDAVSSGDRDGPFELQIMYGIGGERELTERFPSRRGRLGGCHVLAAVCGPPAGDHRAGEQQGYPGRGGPAEGCHHWPVRMPALQER